ncbi:MAG: septum formation protein Maf [Ruminococcaceae bacterium]|nr:septum formation protein Maf [Oscillospiraceae bacterium]
MKKIILGSMSPRRRELLENAGIDFEVITADGEEIVDKSLSFAEIVRSLAVQKSRQVSDNPKCPYNAVVITADTMVVCDNEIMGKPKDNNDAKRMLNMLSDNTHKVLTGYCVFDKETEKRMSGVVETEVKFRAIDEDEIDRYIATGECDDKAGAYGIQLRGSMFVEEIHGDYFNIVGLPVERICKLLKEEFSISLL